MAYTIDSKFEEIREASNATAEAVGGNPRIVGYVGLKMLLIPAVLLLNSFKPFKWLRLPAALMYTDTIYTSLTLSNDAKFRSEYGTGMDLD